MGYFLVDTSDIKSILSTCVPIFFFTNGLLLLHKNKFELKKHIVRILKIVILAILWGGITLAALSLIRNETLTISEFVKGSYYLKQGWNNHIWFLGALIIIYIFYPLLYHTFKTNKQIFYFFFICVMLFTFGNVLLGNLLAIVSFLANKSNNSDLMGNNFGIYNPFSGIHGYSIGYFMLGGIAYKYRYFFNTKKFIYISFCAILISMSLLCFYGIIKSHRQHVIWDIVWSGYDTIFTLLNVIFMFVISLNYKSKGKIGTYVTLLGKNSLGIYFSHIIVGNLFKSIFFQMEISNTLWANITFALLILLISLIITLLLKKVPLLRQLFSI